MPVPRSAEKTPPASTDEFVSSIHLRPAPHPLVKVRIRAVPACSLKRTNVKGAWSDLLSAHRPEEQDDDRYDVGEPEPDVDGARGIGQPVDRIPTSESKLAGVDLQLQDLALQGCLLARAARPNRRCRSASSRSHR